MLRHHVLVETFLVESRVELGAGPLKGWRGCLCGKYVMYSPSMERIAGGRPKMQGVCEEWWWTILVYGSKKYFFHVQPQEPFYDSYPEFLEAQVKVIEISPKFL